MDTRTVLPLTETAAQHTTEHAGSAPGAGACGCGETSAEVPELDVRVIPHVIRHATVFGAWSAIPAGGSLVLVAPHDPTPLLAQLADLGPVTVTYLDQGPQAWRLQITRG